MKKSIQILILFCILNTTNLLAQKFSIYTDTRDNRNYLTVKIGNQIWMAENLAYNNKGAYIYNGDSINSNVFGYLYNWNTAKTVCPQGWHLPTKIEFDTLLNNYGGSEKPKNNYQGLTVKGSSGFNFLLGGWASKYKSSKYLNKVATFWSDTEVNNNPNSAWYLNVFEYNKSSYMDNYGKDNFFSIRCVKNKNTVEKFIINTFTEELKNLPRFNNLNISVLTKKGKTFKNVKISTETGFSAITTEATIHSWEVPQEQAVLNFKKGRKKYKVNLSFHLDSVYDIKLILSEPEYSNCNIKIKSLEKMIFDEIFDKNDIALYNSFLKRYPSGELTNKIYKRVESLRFIETVNSNSTKLYEKYLELYPNNKNTETIKNLYDYNLFSSAYLSNTIAGFNSYIDKSPFDYQKERAISMAYYLASKDNTKQSFDEFVKFFPNSKYEKQAIKNSKQREEFKYFNIANNGTIGNCNHYLSKYPKGKYVSNVKTRKKHLLEEDGIFDKAMNGDKNDCEIYLSKYSKGKYVENVKERKDFLKIKTSMNISELESFMKKYPKGKYFDYVKKQKSSIVVFSDYYHSMRTKTGDRKRDFLGSAKIDFSRDFVIECEVNVKKIIKAKKPYKGYGGYYFDFGDHRVYINQGRVTVKKNKSYIGSEDMSTRTGTQMLKIEKKENSYTCYYKGSNISSFSVDFPSDNELSFAIGTIWGIELTSSVEVKYTSAPEILTEEELYNKAKSGAVVDCDKFIYMFPNSVYTQSVKERKHKLNFIKAGEFNIPEYKLHVLSDKRDGKTYVVMKIDNLWWFVDNLSYSDRNARSFDPGYGRFYNYNISDNTCPTGWRIPTVAEYERNKKEIPTLMTGYLHHRDADGFFQARWHSFNDKGDKAVYWALDNRNKGDRWYGYYTKYPIWKDKNRKSYAWGSSRIRDKDTREKFYTVRCVSDDWTPND